MPLASYLLPLADDELILGHRNSEWCGHAPILEEDIAFANIAQDEMGHARLWYELVCHHTQQTPDHLVFFRAAPEWRNAQMLELPKGDWAFSMVRQYLFDALEMARLPLLAQSANAQIAAVAAKILTEEIYHYRHTSNWVKRLSLGTEESHRRTQAALDALWPYTAQLLDPLPNEARLVAHHLAPPATTVRAAWEALIVPAFAAWGLVITPVNHFTITPRALHTSHCAALLQEMQEVARLEAPEVAW